MTYVGRSPLRAAPPARHFGLDWLRIGAFSLLMLYHVGMVFVAGDWLVKLGQIEWLSYPMLFVSPWRLATLFIVAGFASRALLERLDGARRFAGERTRRLILPLLFAMALIVPPQSWVSLRLNHGYSQDYLTYLTHDAFRFGRLDGVVLPGWEHLWFVFYLWLFTMLLAAALPIAAPAAKARLATWFEQLGKGNRLLWLPLVYFVPVRVAVTFTLGESHGLFDDWLSDLLYLPCFLFGFGLAGTGILWRAIARLWKAALALALASYALLAAVETLYPGHHMPPHAVMALDRAALAAMMWGMALVMLRLADTLLNRDHKWRLALSQAIFPCYIVHQTIIVLVAYWLLPTGLGAALAFPIILAATVLGCWLFYRLGEIAVLRPLIGLNPGPRGYGRRARAILRLRTG
jgi:surface polysaccharide O-acyltransferase-like enzyme